MTSTFMKTMNDLSSVQEEMEEMSDKKNRSISSLAADIKIIIACGIVNLIAVIINICVIMRGEYHISPLTIFTAFNYLYVAYACSQLFSVAGKIKLKYIFRSFAEKRAINELYDANNFEKIFKKLYQDSTNHEFLRNLSKKIENKKLTIQDAFDCHKKLIPPTQEDKLFNALASKVNNIDTEKTDNIQFFQKNK